MKIPTVPCFSRPASGMPEATGRTDSIAAPDRFYATPTSGHSRVASDPRHPYPGLRVLSLGLPFVVVLLALLTPGCASTKTSSVTATLTPVNRAPGVYSAPLYAAAEQGDHQKLQELLQSGADPNGANREGWTPLTAAVARARGLDTNRVTQLLAQCSARPNPIAKNPTLTGRTYAVLAKHKAEQGERELAIKYYKNAIAKFEEAAKPFKSRRTASFLRSLFSPETTAGYRGYGTSNYRYGGISQNVMGMFDAVATGGRGGAHYSREYSVASQTVKQYRAWIDECRKAIRRLQSAAKTG